MREVKVNRDPWHLHTPLHQFLSFIDVCMTHDPKTQWLKKNNLLLSCLAFLWVGSLDRVQRGSEWRLQPHQEKAETPEGQQWKN